MNTKENNFTLYDLVLVSILTAVLIIQKQILSIIPNVQLTFFLIILYSKKLKLMNSIFIVLIFVTIDAIFTGSFGFIYTPYIFMGLVLIPISIKTIFIKVESTIGLASLSVLFSFIYCWLFIIPFVILVNGDFMTYMISDFTFEIILASTSFLTVFILYGPASKGFDLLLNKMNE